MLCEQQTFDIIGNKWLSDYSEVVKTKSNAVSLRSENIRTPTAGIEAMAAMYAAQYDAEYKANFQFLKDNKVFPDPKYYSRLKTKLEKNNYVEFHNGGDLIAELDQKVLEASETYRQ